MADAATVRLPARASEQLATDLLVANGVSTEHAAITASQLVLADLRGVDTHGLMRLPVYIERIERGELKPAAEPAVEQDMPGSATIDAGNGLAQVASHRATMLAIEKAQKVGVGAVTVKNSSHFGAAAGYPMLATEHDCIGLATTNAWPLLPAVGGAARVVGNNPLAIGAPTRLGYPIVFDIAMSQVAAGKLRIAAASDNVIPADWAFDRHGQPTTNAHEALFEGGFLRPMSDHKGFGLAFMMDVLAGVLSGAGFGPHVSGLDDPGYMHVGHFMLVLNIAAFMDIETFLDRIDELAGHVHSSPTRSDVEQVFVPGQIEAETTLRRQREGLTYPRSVYDRLAALAEKAGVEVPEDAGTTFTT